MSKDLFANYELSLREALNGVDSSRYSVEVSKSMSGRILAVRANGLLVAKLEEPAKDVGAAQFYVHADPKDVSVVKDAMQKCPELKVSTTGQLLRPSIV